jgi:hypothetical protein
MTVTIKPTPATTAITEGDHTVTVVTQIGLPFAVSCLAAIRLDHAVARNTKNFLYLYVKIFSTLDKGRD